MMLSEQQLRGSDLTGRHTGRQSGFTRVCEFTHTTTKVVSRKQ